MYKTYTKTMISISTAFRREQKVCEINVYLLSSNGKLFHFFGAEADSVKVVYMAQRKVWEWV